MVRPVLLLIQAWEVYTSYRFREKTPSNKKTIAKRFDDGLAFYRTTGGALRHVLTAVLPRFWAATPHRGMQ
jgi:hypothetical protein